MMTMTVHEPLHAAGGRIERADQLVFVRDGFSWMAAVLTPFWMLGRRLWLPLVGYLAIVVAIELVAIVIGLNAEVAVIPLAALHLLIGFEADAIERWSLARRGYRMVGSANGRNADECERRFFEAWLEKQPFIGRDAYPGRGSVRASGGSFLGNLVWPRRA